MTQPPNQPDKDQNDGLTREFNFPKPWIREYNPQLHGIKPGMGYEQGGSPTAPDQPAAPQSLPDRKTGQLTNQPDQITQPPQVYSQPSQSYPQPTTPPQSQWTTGPVQWNPTGVYGGEAEKQKGLPTWVWTLISAGVLIIVLLLLFFVILR